MTSNTIDRHKKYLFLCINRKEDQNLMLNGIIYYSDHSVYKELSDIYKRISHISIHFCSKISEVEYLLEKDGVIFVIIAVKNIDEIQYLSRISNKSPQTYYIYYYHTLTINNFQHSYFSSFSHIIVGRSCKTYLIKTLRNLTSGHWKKIPYEKFDFTHQSLSQRLKDVMNYIENNELKNCNIAEISKYLKISSGYFSQVFKHETNLNFRNFMQKIIYHYEDLIFKKLKMPPKDAAQILGYSELSSFSRSYKNRKGYPPSFVKNFSKTKDKILAS